MSPLDDALSRLTEEQILACMHVDFGLKDVLFSWEDCGVELDHRGYFLLVQHLRLAYIAGHDAQR